MNNQSNPSDNDVAIPQPDNQNLEYVGQHANIVSQEIRTVLREEIVERENRSSLRRKYDFRKWMEGLRDEIQMGSK